MLFARDPARRGLAALIVPMLAAHSAAAAENEAVPPGYTMARTGNERDFDYFEGGWTIVQKKLKTRGDGADDWETFPGNLCMSLYLDGLATVDEVYFPETKSAGLTVRLFNRETRQWSIYWASSATGKLDPVPVVGGFRDGRGEFYASDTVDGRPVKVRFLWLIKDENHARWEQAFSYDDRTWETNWTANFTRGDPAVLCVNGKPRR